MIESINIWMHSHTDTGEFLGRNWADPPAQRLDIIGMHTDYSIDLLLRELENPESPLSEDIDEHIRNNWPAWREQAVQFEIEWDNGYVVSGARRRNKK